MKKTGAQVLCEGLIHHGVEKIFGIPGEENADLMISLKKSKIEFVLCRHEQAAAFMADVYGRLTGKAGVCLATLGPGVTNLMTGLADANMDRSPVVAIIGQGSTNRLHKESHQIMDSISMVHPISKWAQTILSPENITEVIRKAFKVSETEKPGVTVIEFPEDIADDVTLDDLDFDDFEAWDAPPAPSGPKVKFIPYDDPPKPISAIRPVYPEIAQEAGIEGVVVVQAFIDEKGRVKETIILKGIPNTGLDEAAMEAIRKTRFRPAKQRERAVGVWISIPVNFKLK